jgi:hypothetical protein
LKVESFEINASGPETSSFNTRTKVGLSALAVGVAAYYFRDSWISKISSLPAKISWAIFNK